MTTLPQAAALRLPRPPFSNLPATGAIPVLGPAGYGQQSSGSAMSGADVWRVIRSNLWLILLMLMVGAAAGYGAYYWLNRYHPHYTAEGKVLVLGTEEDTVAGVLRETNNLDMNTLPIEVRRHTTLLKDLTLFTKVLQNPNTEVRSTLWFKRQPSIQDAKEDLIENLDVASAPDSRLINVSMTDSDPNSCKVIVQTIVDQYIKDEQDKNRDQQYSRNQELQQQRISQEDKIKLIDGDIADLQTDLSANGVTGTVSKISVQDMELEELIKDYQEANVDAQGADQQYKTLVNLIQNDPDHVPAVEDMVDKDPKVVQLRTLQSNIEMSLAEQSNNGSVLPDSPTLQSAERNKAMIDQRVADAESQARARYRTQVVEEKSELADSLKKKSDSLFNQIATIKTDMQTATEHMEQLVQKEDERKIDQDKLNKIENELDDIQAYDIKHDVAGVEWASEPELPEIPSFPKLSVVMVVAIASGLLIALGIAFLKELMDTSIRSPRDITRVGALNLLGMVPHEDDDPQSAGARLPVVIFEAPHSMMAEQLRQVRTRLQHSSSLDTSRSILVTSPSPGDGKSTIACNLASGLALNGRRILLVDANFRRPELHRVFNLPNEQGFADVLNSLELFEQAVQETQVPNLFVLPSGHKPTNATELVESQLLVDFIERALEEYDHVIFDSGPLLFVSETVGLAPRVDGVITVVRARINTRGVLSRMRDMLRQIKAEHLGVVLNAVRAQGGGYYGRNIRTYYEYQNNGGRAA